MHPDEYLEHIRESFEEKYFEGKDGFVFSKAALIDGLSCMEHDSMWLECSITDGEYVASDLIYMVRKLQAVANILRISTYGVRLQHEK